jgi:hypothetical protein
VEQGHGWYGWDLDLERTAACLQALREAGRRYERPPELGPLEITVTPSATPDRAAARQFAGLGVDRLVIEPDPDLDEEGLVSFVSEIGDGLVG